MFQTQIFRQLLLAATLLPMPALAFDSGSTGADGAFNPAVNTQLELPPDGVFNFTSVHIPKAVTVTFKKNARNTPVYWLVSGDVLIEGTINLDATAGTATGSAGDGHLGDDSLPGEGGPGGFDGGRGGTASGVSGEEGTYGQSGHGPGGGQVCQNGYGESATFVDTNSSCTPLGTYTKAPYGSPALFPLIGGSGGSGGRGGTFLNGSGGGGGGGAILIASSQTVTIATPFQDGGKSFTGQIYARGGHHGDLEGDGKGKAGGHGTGGGIRIVATTIAGNGTIDARGSYGHYSGRIRMEAENLSRSGGNYGHYSFAEPGPLFLTNRPTLRITHVAGIAAPDTPTGNADISLASTTTNPVTVVFEAVNVPLGNTVALTVLPASGERITTASTALDGTEALSSATASVELPDGPSVLMATVTYTVLASLGDRLSQFAQGERVEKVTLTAALKGETQTILTTVSGKTYRWPASKVALN